MSETLLSIQQYAIKHKVSTFSVIKQINTGKLKTIKKTIDGEEKEFVDDALTHSKPASHVVEQTSINYEIEYHKLQEKFNKLQEKYTALLEREALKQG